MKNELEDNPKISIEEISKNLKITKKDVQAIILDLKMRGELRGKFSSRNGTFKPVKGDLSAQEPTEAIEQAKYCPGCGTPIKKENAQFCVYCGTKFS